MRYREIDGNLLDLFDQKEFEMIGHGANCQGVMGAGIAAQIKERYPAAFYADKYYPLNPLERLGNFSVGCGYNEPGWVVNFYTQFNPGPDADYLWLKSSLRKFNNEWGGSVEFLGLPKIGCGIGGLKWGIVKTIIQKELVGFDVTIVHYERKTE